MSIERLIAEAEDINANSVRFARGISQASTGERLGRIMKACMRENPAAYTPVRSAVEQRVDVLGGAGEAVGLFMLAADTATTAALPHEELTDSDRANLRQLWNDLRSQ